MIQRCEQLYQQLLDDLAYCRSKGLSFLKETEYCFFLAEKYRGLIREELYHHRFSAVEEEVCFFKLIKPKFIAESEYASLLNFAGNFCPVNTHKSDARNFWVRQIYRLEKFKDSHKDFYAYHKSQDTSLDLVYYTRGSGETDPDVFDKTPYDYDLLTGQLLARERYAAYATSQLESLMAKQERKV